MMRIGRECFNPRAREGRDRSSLIGILPSIGFNPRAREGRDVAGFDLAEHAHVSIPAPVKGATPGD